MRRVALAAAVLLVLVASVAYAGSWRLQYRPADAFGNVGEGGGGGSFSSAVAVPPDGGQTPSSSLWGEMTWGEDVWGGGE